MRLCQWALQVQTDTFRVSFIAIRLWFKLTFFIALILCVKNLFFIRIGLTR